MRCRQACRTGQMSKITEHCNKGGSSKQPYNSARTQSTGFTVGFKFLSYFEGIRLAWNHRYIRTFAISMCKHVIGTRHTGNSDHSLVSTIQNGQRSTCKGGQRHLEGSIECVDHCAHIRWHDLCERGIVEGRGRP